MKNLHFKHYWLQYIISINTLFIIQEKINFTLLKLMSAIVVTKMFLNIIVVANNLTEINHVL